ncbi:MAG: hypothetical protein ABIH23_01095 [bacterium]
MSSGLNRRSFLRNSLITSTCGALAVNAVGNKAFAQGDTNAQATDSLPCGKIGDMEISRILLGGNLLTHFTHSRDLKYVYALAKHYNTKEKIFETMRIAEENGINTLVIHTAPGVMNFLREYRYEHGGKIQWIICPTAEIDDSMEAYRKQVEEIVEIGTDAVYLWGVRGDQLVAKERVDLIGKAVEIAKACGVPSGVGAHDLRVVVECEKNNIDNDFYIKTFHHHKYPTGPKPEEITKPYSEIPGYWCSTPDEVIEVMKKVTKPWMAFKVMAAGAIPPADAFQYVFDNGADHVLVGMFDFEIVEDVGIAKTVLGKLNRTRAWMS